MKKVRVALCLALTAALVPLDGLIASAAPAPRPAAVPTGASAYTPVTPSRLADTRAEYGAFGYTRLSPNLIRVQVAGRNGVPKNATAAVLNVASTNAVAAAFVTAYPAGQTRPLAASLNVDVAGRTIANLVTVRLSSAGAVDLYSNQVMDLIVDVAGAYTPVTTEVSAGRLVTFPGGARRAFDSRDNNGPGLGPGGTQYVDLAGVGVPADASAVVVNLAAVDAQVGFWTAYPNGDPQPLASSLNIDEAGQTRNSQGIIRLNPGTQKFNVFSQNGGHLVVDVVGYFTGDGAPASSEGLFIPTSPTRRLDTRDSFSPFSPWGGTTIEFTTGAPLPGQIGAVAMNIAITDPWNVGYITAYPAGQGRPLAANLNITAWNQIISNHAIVREGQRGVALFTQNGAQMIVDVTGWYLGTPDVSSLPVQPIPITSPTQAVAVQSDQAGLYVPIGVGRNIDAIVDRGYAGLWAGTNTLDAFDHNVYFAHRTSAGGPFRNLDRLGVGSTFILVGADGVRYQYVVTRQEIIVPSPSLLVQLVVGTGPITATLVACHPPHSTKYRIAVFGRLIGIVV